MSAFINKSGRRFGRLVVLYPVIPYGPSKMWICRCDCGKLTHVETSRLRGEGIIRSCGCLRSDVTRNRMITHGKSKSPVYAVYKTMLSRCGNPRNSNYHLYGARGITVCEPWKKSFVNFLEDMGEPSRGMTLERVKNDQGYCKENCVWADGFTQGSNKRNNRHITWRGETKILAEWSRVVGVPAKTIDSRLRSGWTLEEAFEK